MVHFEIPADDVERARKFYSTLFGWKIKGYSKNVEDLGGKVLMPKTKVEGYGFFAVCSDTENNSFALWEITEQK